jgi:transcriptional regulator with XRE-family HTH domain
MKVLGKNIGRLRTKLGLTQEQLAEKMNVTRSSIARWENGIDLPKMENLMELAKIFGVSVNELTNTNIDASFRDPQYQSPGQQEYIRFHRTFAKGIAFATSLILLGVAIMLFCLDNYSETVSIIILLSTIIIAVPFYIILGIQMNTLKESTAKADRALPEDVKNKINRNYPLQIAVGVSLILIGIVEVIALYGLELVPEQSLIPAAILMILIAIAVNLFVYGGIQKSAITEVQAAEKLAQMTEEQRKKSELVGKLSGVTMLLATLIYVGCGLFIDSWSWLWPVFPIGGILCGVYGALLTPDCCEK